MNDRLRRPPVEREVDEEIAFHLEMRVRELMAEGMGEEEARSEATRRLGDVERMKARMRNQGRRRDGRMGRRRWWDEMRQDLAFAVRQLRREPAFAAVAIVTLALAIGANTAVFSVVDGVLLRPLPYERPDELAMLWTRYLPISGFDIPKFPLSGPEYLDYKESTHVFRQVGSYRSGGSRALTGEGQDAERIPVAFVSAEVVPLLGVRPWIGRAFTAEEDAADGPAVTVLGWDLWTSRYGADSTLVGRTLDMNGVPTEVVGVMPRGFDFPGSAKAWLPMQLDRSNEGGRAGHGIYGIGRLAPGKTLADADAELEVVKARWAAEYEHNVGHFVWAEDAMQAAVGDAPRTLLVLLSAVGLVLLVACANVANLLLARGERRQVEVAVRTALGAGRSRITRQLLTESLVLAGIAAALGLGLAQVGTRAMIAMAPTALPRLDQVRVDPSVLLFTAGIALLTAALFGVVPGLLAGRKALSRAASSGRGRAHGRGILRRGLVAGEVALSLVVVLLAGLLVKSWMALDRTDRGLETSNLLLFSITLPSSAYPEDRVVPGSFDALLDRIRQVPGVAGVTAGTTLPFTSGWSRWDFELDDRPPRKEGDRAWSAGISVVTPGFFETLGIPVLAGRGIGADDREDAPLVGVVSEAMASTYWPGESPLGKRWGYGASADSTRAWITVVGVARDPVRERLDEEPYPFVWVPAAQADRSAGYTPRTLSVAVRTGVDPDALVAQVRDAVRAFDPNLPLYGVRTMDDAVAATLARPRLTTNLLGAFAFLALLLATVGIYGVISYSVAGRTREIGIRVALGARRAAVVRMILAEGARPVLLGIGVGLGGAWFATRLLGAMLYQVAPRDPTTFVALPAGLLLVALVASWLPALRATRIPPTQALRQD